MVLGNGGATAFWDIATFGLIREQEPAPELRRVLLASSPRPPQQAPFLDEPSVIASEPGSRPTPKAEEGVDAYAWAHNETSTAVMAPVRRVDGPTTTRWCSIDATSGAGGLPVDLSQVDAYYFAPQKCFASDGGLWVALMSPRRWRGRTRSPPATGGCRPSSTCRRPSTTRRKNQTYNTPSVATLFLMAEQLDWMNAQGGLDGMVERTTASSDALYGWAERTSYTTPYVPDPSHRSLVIGTIDFDDAIDAAADREDPARQRHRGHRALPQAGPQPAPDRDVPRDRPERRRDAHRLHRPRGRAALTSR